MPPVVGYVASHEQFAPSDLIAYAVAAEKAGFDALWVSDHFHPWQDNQGHAAHAWITLAAMGQRTERLLLGTGITCPIYRYNPAEVAHAFASLGVLYPDRLFLGVGTGEALNEVAAGGGWGPYRERAERLAEAITLIRRLWTEDWVTFEGRYYRLEDAKLYDKPARPVPIYVAGAGPRSARLAGRYGDGWITDVSTLTGRQDVVQAFEEGARAAGKDPTAMPRLVEPFVIVGGREEAQEAARLWLFHAIGQQVLDMSDPRQIQRYAEENSTAEREMEQWLISGDPQAHLDAIKRLVEAGATHVFVHSAQRDQRRFIDFYGREVLPALRRL
jgi:TAT-translocated FGD2 family F420-dependent dehydrogenase